MIKAEELMGFAPECFPSFIHCLKRTNLYQDVQRELTDGETRQALQEIDDLLSQI
jgi:hypothetical protein